jgi:hypothetical protein
MPSDSVEEELFGLQTVGLSHIYWLARILVLFSFISSIMMQTFATVALLATGGT